MPPKKAAPTPRKSGSGSTSGANTKKPSIAKPKGSPASKSTVVSKKKSTPPKKSTAKVKDQADTKGKVATKEDAAATKIQSHFRVMLAKKEVGRRKIEKEQYDKEMERLEREAWLQIVRREREAAEKERQKEEEERKRRKEEERRKKVILEAAFDGDKQLIINVLDEAKQFDISYLKTTGQSLELQILRHQMNLIGCEDANHNTPLSEASAGGDGETIEFLINKGADVNSRGAFKRTPLYRAAFGGHFNAVQVLLENGADPRLFADDGNTPEQIASVPHIVDVLANWDIQETEKLIARNETKRQERLKLEKEYIDRQTKLISEKIAEAEKIYKAKQKQLQKAYEELNKRIFEHDKCSLENQSKTNVTLQAVHDAEEALVTAKQEEEVARDKLSNLRLELREESSQSKEQVDLLATKGVKCNLRELDDVLMRDVGGKIRNDGRWPLIVDPSGQSSIFLRYRDTNYINALNVREMEPEYIRNALLGAIRFGKFLVIDMMQIDMLEGIENRLEEIEKGLFKKLVDQSLMKNDRFLTLVRPTDGDEFAKEKFAISRLENFKFVLLTNIWNPPEHWLELFYPIKVIISS